jgi:predicted AlkP superfamily phosphohydrolase/phosphomutase
VQRWAADGTMPAFASLRDRGVFCALDNEVELLPDAMWLDLTSGQSAVAAGLYWQPEQVHAGEARMRANIDADIPLTPVWRRASDAGRRVAVIDAVYARSSPGLNGVVLYDWGAHSAGAGRGSEPSSYIDDVVVRYGDYPLPHGWSEADGRAWGCDVHDGSRAALADLPRRLTAGIEVKEHTIVGELGREDWDLFFAVFHEGHCAGHQLWHFVDPTSPWHDPDAPEELRESMRAVYARLDQALGRVLAAVEPDTEILVLLTRGMGKHIGGWQLLPEILVRLGYASASPVAASIRSRVPPWARRWLRTVVRGSARERVKSVAGTPTHPLESPRTKACWVRCGKNGAIRLNVRGRDPHGAIEPGDEYDRVCADLARELLALRDGDTGAPVVKNVLRSDEMFRERHHPNLPDLIVQFQSDSVITQVTSPSVGTASVDARAGEFKRTGEHTANVMLWYLGAQGEPGSSIDGAVRDVAPTILEMLSVPLPDDLDGSPLALGDPKEVQREALT